MKCTLLGFKSLDFKNNEGEKVEGIKLYLAYPDEKTVGTECDAKFINQKVFDSFGISYEALADAVDTVINVEFGMKNKVIGLNLS